MLHLNAVWLCRLRKIMSHWALPLTLKKLDYGVTILTRKETLLAFVNIDTNALISPSNFIAPLSSNSGKLSPSLALNLGRFYSSQW